MPVSRLRMRPWLEMKIESKAIEGLRWMDKEKTTFSIPWKHAARHGWQIDKDANLFQQWAVHTGKYVPGSTQPDPKTWKANFRCAMNSLPDIEEVKDKSVNKGSDAVRVYRMLPEVHKKEKRSKSRQERRKTKDKDSRTRKAEDSNMSEGNMDVTQENTVDSTKRTDFGDEEIPYISTVEILPDSTDRWTGTFQVSPQHSTDFEDEDAVMRLTQQLEQSSQLEQDQPQWFTTSDIDGRDYLSNEIGQSSDSYHSPQSHWSDTTSADMTEEVEFQLVAELVSKLEPMHHELFGLGLNYGSY